MPNCSTRGNAAVPRYAASADSINRVFVRCGMVPAPIDVIWAVEHTALTHYAHMSAPETFLAFIANLVGHYLFGGIRLSGRAGALTRSARIQLITLVGTHQRASQTGLGLPG